MCYGVIYTIENKIDGKIYVGQTTKSFNERYRGDISKTHNKHLKRSIKKYNIENFAIDKCICECDTRESLNEAEKFYIDFFDSANPEHGYNMTLGGEGMIANEETKQKISEARKGKCCGEKHPMWGKKISEEHKQKISKSLKGKYCGEKSSMWGKYHSEETKKKQSKVKKGKHLSDEHKQKISKALSGEKNPMYNKNSEDYMTEEAIKIKREKQSKALSGEKHPMYNKHHSEETKQKISKALSGENSYWYGKHLSNEHKRKISEAKKGEKHPMYNKHLSEETKKKMSEAKKGKNNYRAKPIVQLDKQGNFIRKWDYIKQAEKELNIGNISNCCRGVCKSAGGYIWKYLDEFKNETTGDSLVPFLNKN